MYSTPYLQFRTVGKDIKKNKKKNPVTQSVHLCMIFDRYLYPIPLDTS